ncbi:MAG: hypothetical protein ABI234_15475 [Ktedonobacteraceae bacterium]
MSKIKMRCITCSKWFQSANAKEVTCSECVQKAKKDKMASKAAPPVTQKISEQGNPGTGSPAHPVLPPKPKPAANTSHWFDSVSDVKISEPDQPPRPKLPPARESYGGQGNRGQSDYRGERPAGPGDYRRQSGYRDERPTGPGGYRDERPTGQSGYRGPSAYLNAPLSGSIAGGIGQQRPRQPGAGGPPPARGPRPGGPRVDTYRVGAPRGGRPMSRPKPALAPKPKREKIPPPEPFHPTPEQIAQVEARYLELAVPSEFDGIRSQIAQEIAIPKKAVKNIIKELREREHIPSWWESQVYKGDNEEKEKIKVAYEPYLPVPPVGVHRQLADELDLKPGLVYQAIKTIRTELNLPQYNDPTFHESEFEEIKRKQREVREAKEAAKVAKAAAEAAASAETTSEQVLTVEGESGANQNALATDTATSADAQSAPTTNVTTNTEFQSASVLTAESVNDAE